MKKTMRKIVPAVLMLLISAMLVGTSTYAWFSMNTRVTVTGMSVTARVSDNILISESNVGESGYGSTLLQARNALVAPTSTIDGVSYWYANSQSNVNADGSAKEVGGEKYTAYNENMSPAMANASAGKANYDPAFQAQAGVTGAISTSNVAYGYIDYVFYIKATNAAGTAKYLTMTGCNLLYNGAAPAATDQAWRVAVFAQDVTGGAGSGNLETAVTSSDLITILTPVESASAAALYRTSGKAAKTASTVDDVASLDSAANLKQIATGGTVCEKITVRLWLEGEDKTCKNENYVSLTNAWTLDLAFAIDGTAVAQIQALAIVDSSVSGDTGTVTLTTGSLTRSSASISVTPARYTWYQVSSGVASVAAGTVTDNTFKADATGDYFCLIVGEDGKVYRTTTMHLTVS